MTPSLGSINLLDWLTHLPKFTGLLKDTDEQPDEEMYQVRSGRILGAGASVPVGLGGVASSACGYIYQPGSSLNLVVLEFYGGFTM